MRYNRAKKEVDCAKVTWICQPELVKVVSYNDAYVNAFAKAWDWNFYSFTFDLLLNKDLLLKGSVSAMLVQSPYAK